MNEKELRAKLAQYELNIKNDNQDHEAYYMKAVTLAGLGHLLKDNYYFVAALDNYSIAIKEAGEQEEKKPEYYAKRSEIYSRLGNFELAINDIHETKKIGRTGDSLTDKYVNITIENILKLDKIKNTIQDLVSSKIISLDLAQILEEHISVTKNLAIQIGAHDKKLEDYKEEIKKLNELVQQLQEKQLYSDEEVKQLKFQIEKDTSNIQKQLNEYEGRITNIEGEIVKFVNTQELEELASVTQEKFTALDNKILITEEELNNQRHTIVHIDNTLRQANIFDEVKIKKAFSNLQQNYDSSVNEYATKFYWTLSNYLLTYRILSTGLVTGNTTSTKASFVEKVSNVITTLLGSVLPIGGGAIGVINSTLNDIYKGFLEVKFERQVSKVNDSILSTILDKDLNLAIANSSIEIAKTKSSLIKRAANESTKSGYVSEAMVWFQDKLDKGLAKITGVKSVYESKIAKMALQDVTLFIGSIINAENKLIDNNQSIDNLTHKITTIFKEEHMYKQLAEVFSNHKHKRSDQVFNEILKDVQHEVLKKGLPTNSNSEEIGIESDAISPFYVDDASLGGHLKLEHIENI